jgi:hypothetical protein
MARRNPIELRKKEILSSRNLIIVTAQKKTLNGNTRERIRELFNLHLHRLQDFPTPFLDMKKKPSE